MEWLALIIAIPALVWAFVLSMRASLVGACLVFVAANACLGYFFFHFQAGPVELTLDRVILVFLAILFVIKWRLGELQSRSVSRMDWAVLGLMAWLAIRTFTADFLLQTANEPAPYWRLIVGYMSPLFIYWVARGVRYDERSVRLIQAFFVSFGVYLAATAVAEITGQWWAVFPRHIADPDVGLHFGRARGPMVQSVVFGFCLTVCTVCACLYRQRSRHWSRRLILLTIPLMLAGIFFSYTRCVWLGAAIALGLVVWLSSNWRIRMAIVGTICLASVLVVATQWEQLQSFSGGRSEEASRDSASMRVSFAYVSWQMFRENPVAGCGFGHYMHEKDAYLSDRSTALALEHIRHHVHHNLFLSILVETGLVGLILFLVMLVLWAHSSWLLWRSESAPNWARAQGLIMLATLVAYLPNAMFQPLGHTNIVHMTFFFLAGVTSGLQTRTALGGERRRSVAAATDRPFWSAGGRASGPVGG